MFLSINSVCFLFTFSWILYISAESEQPPVTRQAHVTGQPPVIEPHTTRIKARFHPHRTKRQVIKTASVGGKKILECNIEYPGGVYTPHIIKWTKKSLDTPIYIKFYNTPPHVDLRFQDRIKLVSQAAIELSDIRDTDEGWYECHVSFLDRTDETTQNGTWIYLSVNAPPVVTQASPSIMQQKSGATITIFCEAKGTPQPMLMWTKDGQMIKNGARVTVERNKVHLQNLEVGDGGVYSCNFENIVGEASRDIKVVVEGGTYIIEPPTNNTAREGSKIKFSCRAEAFPNNISYMWFKGGVSVTSLPNTNGRITVVHGDGSLMIDAASRDDMGWYKCRPSNGLGAPPEAAAFLNITFLPNVDNMPSKLYLPRSLRGHIRCPVVANPPVTQVLWTKNGHAVSLSSSTRITFGTDWSLLFTSVINSDAGKYTCTPYSLLGTGNTSPVVEVFVKDPPYFTVRPQSFYQRLVNDTVTMLCSADGDPKPSITWRKTVLSPLNSRELVANSDGSLTLRGLEKSDHGGYECVASNVVTSIIMPTTLIIESTTPHAPYNVSVTSGLFEAKLTWMPAYDGGFRQHYYVWFKATAEKPWKRIRVLPDGATSFTLYNLLSDTEYEFTILSRNKMGDGKFSDSVIARTKGFSPELVTALPTDSAGVTYIPKIDKPQGPAPGPPRGVTIRWNNGNVEISWQPPAHSPVPVMYYKIERYQNGHWEVFSHEMVNKTRFVIQGFKPENNYKFRVISYGVLNTSEPSPAVELLARTAGRENGGLIMSQAAIWGIVGGLLFLLIAVILALIAVKCVNQRRTHDNAMSKYGNVKYFGPKQLQGSSMSEISERSMMKENYTLTNGGGIHNHSHNNGHNPPVVKKVKIMTDIQESAEATV